MENLEISTLTHEDLQDVYYRLLEKYMQMKDENEKDTQKIYELKRNLETALATQEYLTSELEQLNGNSSCAESAKNNKLQTELEELKRKQSSLNSEYATLQQDYEQLQEYNADLKQQLQAFNSKSNVPVEPQIDHKMLDTVHALEGENLELLSKLEEFQQNAVQQTMVLGEKEVIHIYSKYINKLFIA